NGEEKRMARTTTVEAPRQPKTLDEYLAWLQMLQAAGADLRPVAENLFREKFALQDALDKLKEHQEELREELETLLAPERYPAVITNVHCNGDTTVEVHGAGMRMQVAVHPDVDSEQLKIGARGLLSKSRNCLLSVEESGPSWHDIGTFEGYAGERRILVRHQEQLVAADVADDLLPVELH